MIHVYYGEATCFHLSTCFVWEHTQEIMIISGIGSIHQKLWIPCKSETDNKIKTSMRNAKTSLQFESHINL